MRRQHSNLRSLIADIGQPVRAFGPTCAALLPFDGFTLRPPFHFLIPRGRNVRRIGHIVHTTTVLDPIDCEEIDGIPVVSPARTLIDLSGMIGDERLTAALDGALRDGLVTEDFLHRRIAALRTSGRYGIPKLLAVIDGFEITRGGQSWLEREYLRLLAQYRFPRPLTQQVLGRARDRLIRVDFHFAGTPVVVETHGYRWHSSRAQHSIDLQRVNQLAADGAKVVQFSYDHVVSDPRYVIETTYRALKPYLRVPRPRFV